MSKDSYKNPLWNHLNKEEPKRPLEKLKMLSKSFGKYLTSQYKCKHFALKMSNFIQTKYTSGLGKPLNELTVGRPYAPT